MPQDENDQPRERQPDDRETERLTAHAVNGSRSPEQRPPPSSADANVSIEPAAFEDEPSTAMPVTTDAESSSQYRRQHHRTVLLFSITTILLFADQNLLSPNLTAVANEFGFTNQERDRKLGGDIALAFFLLGAPASCIVGCLADQSNRSILFALTVCIGEGACFATYFTKTYIQLYVCRAITGFSVGGAIPLIYSVLGDLFAAQDRHAVSAVIGIGTGVGIAFGQGVAGFLGPTFGWRIPFLVVSIPALLCATLVGWTVPDPERGSMERIVIDMRQHPESYYKEDDKLPVANDEACIEMQSLNRQTDESPLSIPDSSPPRQFKRRITKGSQSESSTQSQQEECVSEEDGGDDSFAEWDNYTTKTSCGQDWRLHFKTLLSLFSCPTVLLAFFQGAPGCLPWGIVNQYLNDFLAEDRGMTVEGATATVLFFGLGNFFGLLVGGAGGRYLYMLDCRYPAILAGSSAILGCIPFWLLLTTIDGSSHVLYIGVVTLLSGLGTGVTGPIVKATLQNVTLPTTRGQAFAIYNLFDDFGRGLGPVFVSLLIVQMGGRTPAFNVGVLGWVVCGILNVAIFFTVARDERKAQATLAASMHIHQMDSSYERVTISSPEDNESDSPIV